MERARDVGLALDVDDSGPPHGEGRGDARRPPEGMIAQIEHGETVHLPDLRPLRVDQDHAVGDDLAQLLLGQRDALAAGGERPSDLLAADERAPFA